MSRVGKQPIVVPSGVECKLDGVALKVKGPKDNSIETFTRI